MTEIQYIPINQIDLSEQQLQMRHGGIDWDFSDTLADTIREGKELTPVHLFLDETTGKHYIGDGWHRCFAYQSARPGKAQVPATVSPGGRAAALHHALGANADQLAKPRTRKDIRKAVIRAIETYMLGKDAVKNMQCIFSGSKKKATQEQIAEMCKVNQSNVSRILKDLKAKAKASAAATEEGENSENLTPADPQTTFFNALDKSFETVMTKWTDVRDYIGWTNPDITKQDKLAAIKDLKLNLKTMLKDVEKREEQITNAVEEEA